MIAETPLYKLMDYNANEIFIKRDDLLTFSFGGNKARIAEEFFYDMEQKGCDCIIGYGNARSNLSRVISNFAYKYKIPCKIISPSDDDGTRIKTANSRLVGLCETEFITCSKNNVAQTVENTIFECRKSGFKPYYIYGDKTGNGNKATPVKAYKYCYDEIKKSNVSADYIFLPVGTGMSYSGLFVGNMICSGNENIVGISIARNAEKAKDIIKNYSEAYLGKELNSSQTEKINVIDDFLCGGYSKYNNEIENMILNMYKLNGIPLDPTYTGKTFYGMLEYLKGNEIKNKKILFIHTGGTPLFFDYLNQKNT